MPALEMVDDILDVKKFGVDAKCKVLNIKSGVCQETTAQIFETCDIQKVAVRKFILRNSIRSTLLQELEGLPGLDNTGHKHTSLGGAGERRRLLHDSSSDIPVLM